MAGHTFVNVFGLVLLLVAVITQEHNLRECQSVHHKIKTFLGQWKWFWVFTRWHLSLFSCTDQKHVRIYKYAINLIGGLLMVGWRSCLTQCHTVTEVKHGWARSGVGWVTTQVIDQ